MKKKKGRKMENEGTRSVCTGWRTPGVRGKREESPVHGPLILTKAKLPTLRFTGDELRISNGRGRGTAASSSSSAGTSEWLFKLRINMLARAGRVAVRTLDSSRFLAIKPPLKWKSKRNRLTRTMGTSSSISPNETLDPVNRGLINVRGTTFTRTFESDNGSGLTKFH